MPRISERQRQARRQQILDAARGVFTLNGFHATSMDEIIAAAGMSSGGVYRYFSGKDAIITAIAQEVVGGITATVSDLLGDDRLPPMGDVLRRLVIQIDTIADGPGRLALQVWGEAQRDPEIARMAAVEATVLRSAVLDLVRRAHTAGQLPEHTDIEALGQVLFSLIPGYLMQKRIIGDLDPIRYADAMDAMLQIR
ncbi:TetR/AcrR family transcriptional regulator [Lapillicoccus sp.]|uniref:TetR/AcrR family transcriptional regulator n=1 Tax=Lapillicoccus sp. TaxID=1909287 RepID=UPI0032648E59